MIAWLAACVPPDEAGDLGALPSSAPDAVRFVAVGDPGKGNAAMRAVAAQTAATCRAWGCDFVVVLGDLLYPAGVEGPDDHRLADWVVKPYAEAGVPVVLLLGNHDYGNSRQWAHGARAREQALAAGALLPAPYFRWSAGPATFLGLDTSRLYWGDANQQRWLDEALAAADAPWVVTLGHHTWRSVGPHGNAGAYDGWPAVPWLSGAALSRTFDGTLCGRADLHLAGHDHSLQLLEGPCGETLVVSGAAGGATRVRATDPTGATRASAVRWAAATSGLAWISLGDTGEVRFVDADGALLHTATFPRRRAADRARPH
jgi:tartrate-resistant acid phosphatase type 5